jgi:hypothetical protein
LEDFNQIRNITRSKVNVAENQIKGSIEAFPDIPAKRLMIRTVENFKQELLRILDDIIPPG